RRGRAVVATRVTGEAQEVARAEAQAVLSMVVDEGRRARLADVVAAVDEGVVEGADADALAEVLELGLQTGRVRALYGPGGEQAALGVFRRSPLRQAVAAAAPRPGDAPAAAQGRASA